MKEGVLRNLIKTTVGIMAVEGLENLEETLIVEYGFDEEDVIEFLEDEVWDVVKEDIEDMVDMIDKAVDEMFEDMSIIELTEEGQGERKRVLSESEEDYEEE